MSESNYDVLRGRMALESWEDGEDGTGGMVRHAPTNEQILTLLDALNADLKGEEHPDVAEVRRDRWWSS